MTPELTPGDGASFPASASAAASDPSGALRKLTPGDGASFPASATAAASDPSGALRKLESSLRPRAPRPLRWLLASALLHAVVLATLASFVQSESRPPDRWTAEVRPAAVPELPPEEPLPSDCGPTHELPPPPEEPDVAPVPEPPPLAWTVSPNDDASDEREIVALATSDRLAATPPVRGRAGTADGEGDSDGSGTSPHESGAAADTCPATLAPQVVAARAVDPKAPPYPGAARRAGIEGVVRLEADVDAEGCVTDVRVVESSGSSTLDDAAVTAVRAWRYAPATVDGVAVPATVRIPPIRFRLEGRG